MPEYIKLVVQLQKFLTSALDRDKWLALHTHRLSTSDRASSMQQGESLVDPTASLDVMIKRKICPIGNHTIPQSSNQSHHYADWATQFTYMIIPEQ
jgi:hypothetical protein